MRALQGQHFLINNWAIKKIVASLDISPGDTIIEIGPGKGALTMPIAKECKIAGSKLIAIEKDLHLAKQLMGYANHTNRGFKDFEVIQGDVLKLINSLTHKLTNYKLVGNIPYYITGRLLRLLSELENKPKLTVLTLQKEVALRLTAEVPKMNLLSAITGLWAEAKTIQTLEPNDFSPPPKVSSAVIRLVTKDRSLDSTLLDSNYYRLVKTLFKQPRKTILNNLRARLKIGVTEITTVLKGFNLTGRERPQDLSLAVLTKLAQIIK